MSFSRNIFSSSKNRLKEASNLLRRYGQGRDTAGQPIFRGFHSSSYRSGKKTNFRPLMSNETPATSFSWRYYIIPTVVLGGIGGAVSFLHYNDERRAILKGQEAKSECRNTNGPVIGGPFNLIDTAGRFVTQRDLLGSWVLLYFGYTSSPDVGPAEVQKLAKAIDILGSRQDVKVLPIFVTIDPQRDTPSHLRAYLKEFDPRIVGLTGSVSAIRQMAQEYRVYFKRVEEDGDDYLVESSHKMYLMNPNLEIVRCFGVEYSPEELSEALMKEIKMTEK